MATAPQPAPSAQKQLRECIAAAKAAAAYKGRAPTARRQAESALELLDAGTKPAAVAAKLVNPDI